LFDCENKERTAGLKSCHLSSDSEGKSEPSYVRG
jgi:hypothetical protein